jgi:hypothetical protein
MSKAADKETGEYYFAVSQGGRADPRYRASLVTGGYGDEFSND